MSRIVTSNGTIIYRNENGKYHREDGPAVIHLNGDEYWYINGKLHREDGPAETYTNGEEHWFINGEDVTILVKDHVTNWRNWTEKEKLVFKLIFL